VMLAAETATGAITNDVVTIPRAKAALIKVDFTGWNISNLDNCA
jgi:hypothetical protein